MRSAATAPASPVAGAAVQAAPLGAVARRLLGVCRAHHGRAVGLSTLALRSGLRVERCGEELHELAAAGLVRYTSSAAPLWAPAAPWQPALCFATATPWGVVCSAPQPGHPRIYQQQAAAGSYATQAQAQSAADQLNHAAPVLRLRPADRYAELPEPQFEPHPWDLK
ncbi:hypothetical protein EJV47_04550 [Hymenobacter gummosus]|uniref:Uncharacterized protein n=1 Tax=Hymenobacter gummosus TaxID=1776032 RepID=A0A3S0JJJ2_9BACT|nr:hypothetical protein [Hymenobacter gummosus]RTQ52297.1 hypothetical protein EJV47_04550 [Hymenobacter gummosus]